MTDHPDDRIPPSLIQLLYKDRMAAREKMVHQKMAEASRCVRCRYGLARGPNRLCRGCDANSR